MHAVKLLLSPTISYKKGIKENCDDIVGKSVEDFWWIIKCSSALVDQAREIVSSNTLQSNDMLTSHTCSISARFIQIIVLNSNGAWIPLSTKVVTSNLLRNFYFEIKYHKRAIIMIMIIDYEPFADFRPNFPCSCT